MKAFRCGAYALMLIGVFGVEALADAEAAEMKAYVDPATGELVERPAVKEERPSEQKAHPKDKAVAEGRVYVHPVTGELVSTPVTAEQRQVVGKVAKMLRADKSGLPMQVFPNGAIRIQLDERFQENMQIAVNADGGQDVACGSLPGHGHASSGRGSDVK